MLLLRGLGPASAFNLEDQNQQVLLTERTITCPCIREEARILSDLSLAQQTYVEDCSIFHQSFLLHDSSLAGGLLELEAQAENGK